MSATDVDTTVDVDLTLTPRCDHSQHDLLHPGDEPAAVIVEARCPACGAGGRCLWCEPGLRVAQAFRFLICNECGHPVSTAEWVTVVAWL